MTVTFVITVLSIFETKKQKVFELWEFKRVTEIFLFYGFFNSDATHKYFTKVLKHKCKLP